MLSLSSLKRMILRSGGPSLLYVRLSFLTLALGFLLFPVFCWPTATYTAPANPDSIAILDAKVFRDIKVANDQLYFVRYDVSYTTEPTQDADKCFQMVLYNNAGTLVLYSRDLLYYQHNIFSIYLTPAQALVWDSNYKVRIQGKVGVFSPIVEDVNMDTWTLQGDDYLQQTDFAAYMIYSAKELEDDWGLTLVTYADKLNETGAITFNDAIPGLSQYYPDLYETVVSVPVAPASNWTYAYITTLGTHEGTNLHNAMIALGGFVGITGDWMAFWIILLGGFVLGSIIYAFSGSSAASLGFAFAALPLGVWMGLGSALFNLMAVIVIILAIGFGIVFILVRFA